MTDAHDPWPTGRGASELPGDLWHPDPSAVPMPAGDAGQDRPEFPQTGWSATVMSSSGAAWQAAADEPPGPSYEWRTAPWAENPAAMPPDPAPAVAATPPGPMLAGSRLGIAAFTVVTSMTLACVYLAYCVGRCMGTAMVAFSTPVFDPFEIAKAAPMMSDQLSLVCVLGFLASLIGVGGLAVAIVARLRRSAPALSLTAVIVGLCSPMLAFIALLAATEPFIHQMS